VLDTSGHLKIDRTRWKDCGCDEFYDAPVLAYGKQVSYGPFHCLSQEAGMRSVVAATGKGFLISRSGIARVGGWQPPTCSAPTRTRSAR
jgi:hypothetical protein